MIVTGKWELYTPEEGTNPVIEGALYLKDSYANDWYEFQSKFKEDSYKVLFQDDGKISAVENDASRLFPINLSVAEFKTLPEDFNQTAYIVQKGKLTTRVYTEEETIAATEALIKRKVARIGHELGALSGLSVAGILSEDQKKRLEALTTYVKEVYGVDKSNPVWPKEP